MEPINGHLHKLKRVLRGNRRTKEFGCTHPHCSFLRHSDYLVGKAASCAYCEKEFIISRFALNKHGLLHCEACGKSKKVVDPNTLEEKLDKILFGKGV